MASDSPGDAQNALRERVVRLEALLDVAARLTEERDLDRLLDNILKTTTEVMEADRSSLYLIDWDRREIEAVIAQRTGRIRMPLNKGIASHVALTGEIYRSDDVYRDPRFNREFDIRDGYRTKSMLCAPMNTRAGERIGVIQVINKLTADTFSDQDVELLQGLCSLAAVAIENARYIEEQRLMLESFMETLMSTIDHRDYITGGHSARVTSIALMIARELGINDPQELRILRYAGMVHDYGKIGVPEAVLTKPGRLTEEEYAEMKRHAVYTKEMLQNMRWPRDLTVVPDIAAQHHERLDGNGYPDGLPADKLCLGSRILAVADVFDALSSSRHYREAMPLDDLVALLRKESGTHIDGDCVEALVRILPRIVDRFPDHFPASYREAAQRLAQTAAPRPRKSFRINGTVN